MASAEDMIAKLAAQASGTREVMTASQQLAAQIAAEQAAIAGLAGQIDQTQAKIAALAASEYATAEAYEFEVAKLKKLQAAEQEHAQNAAKYSGAAEKIAALEKERAAQEAKVAADKKAEDDAKKAAQEQKKAAAEAERMAAEQAQAERDKSERIIRAAQKMADGIVAFGQRGAAAITSFGAFMATLATVTMPTATQAFAAFGGAVGGFLSGAGAKLNEGLSAIGDKLSGLGPAGAMAGGALKIVGAAAEAATAMLGATIGTIGTLIGVAVDVNQHLEMMRIRFDALAGGAKAGGAAYDMVMRLGQALPFSTQQVGAWAQSMMAAGLEGKRLEASVKAIAAASALMGEGGAAAAEKFFKRLGEGGPSADKLIKEIQTGGRRADQMLKEMGLSVKDLSAALGTTPEQFAKMKLSAEQLNDAMTKALQKKGAGPLEAMMMTMPVILDKAREGILSLFEGVAPLIKPLMSAVKELFGEFNKGGAATKGLKGPVTEALGTVIQYATRLVNIIHAVVLGFMGSEKAHGPWSNVGRTLRQVYENGKQLVGMVIDLVQRLSSIGGGSSGMAIIEAGLYILIGAFQIAMAVVQPFLDTITLLDGVWQAVSAAFSEGGANIVQSLADALDPGVFIAKMTSMAMSGLAAFKAALGIASPSKVMMQMGGHLATGLAEGVDAGSDKAQAATENMVDPGAIKVRAKGGASGSGGKIVYIERLYIGGREQYEEFRQMLRGEFEVEELA